jgi:hypothetical protein
LAGPPSGRDHACVTVDCWPGRPEGCGPSRNEGGNLGEIQCSC